ncbi:MAG: polyprenyl synthetase family protein, partial [Chloroflexota bacterium]|nr:polyprenyl synthetase family protein [Chloroflexota bacterium]
PYDLFLPAAVACEFMAAGYDVLDAVTDQAPTLSPKERAHTLAASAALLRLSHELLVDLDLPHARCVRAAAALARTGLLAEAGHARDIDLRRQPAVSQDALFAVLRLRSGTLVAAPCQLAALLAGAPWRAVAVAGEYGYALGCAAQLEDDLADMAEDERSGRKTVPLLLARLYPMQPEVAEAATWVLIRRFQREAARLLTHPSIDQTRTEALWTLLPPALHAA